MEDHELEMFGYEGDDNNNGQTADDGNTQVPAPNTVGKPPQPKILRDTFPAIQPFAGSYKSAFTSQTPRPARKTLACLEHVNCSYLSSGVAPTLLELKQHAQSLAVLIREMTVSTMPALIDNHNAGLPGLRPFHANESWDWLNDLTTPYDTAEPHHLQPLTSLLNSVEDDREGVVYNTCPLQKVEDEGEMVQVTPFASHAALVEHANELLERLDHEYSAKGGLLSIYPTEMEKEDREKAKQTVLGQLIFWVQNLVKRVHHLERLYANAMDLLTKEAVVPTEALTALGTKGRKGREVVYPQDRFVLVNAGDDLWAFLNAEFERKEIIDTEVDKNYRDLGAAGVVAWEERGGREFARGITCIDVFTRYYRLRDSPLKTIFVIPAYEKHPGTKVTRDMEQQPTVVSVVKPVYPERMSVLETKHKSDMTLLRRMIQENTDLKARDSGNAMQLDFTAADRDRERAEKVQLQAEVKQLTAALKEPANQTKFNLITETSKLAEACNEAANVRATYEGMVQTAKDRLAEANTRAEESRAAAQKHRETLDARREQFEKEWAKRMQALDERDADIARAAQSLIPEIKKPWMKQFSETQILIEFLASPEAQEALKNVKIPANFTALGKAIGKKVGEAVMKDLPDTAPIEIPSSSSSSSDDDGDESDAQQTKDVISDAPTTARWRRASHQPSAIPTFFAAQRQSALSQDAPATPSAMSPQFRDTYQDSGRRPSVGFRHSPNSRSLRQSIVRGPLPALDHPVGPTPETPGSARSPPVAGTPRRVAFTPTLEQGPSGSTARRRSAEEEEEEEEEEEQQQQQQQGSNKRARRGA